ncbi:trigger factor [Desulfofundulus thermobenzoicus]|uniref:Trigger factor n=1 Tax=Desulfofundulus thermobenzoicus TaxID=29376 RepID=A0A6N7ILF3_9FIRM|nr:trigger factor [Desulfofundulus thermobenzoicus]MQL50812.1 trigger factor [Desulfofundulus thermobenzoicus]HHW44046.1 trigger factor [Desulfotomaculum sp.]
MKANAERIEKNTVLLEVEVDNEQFSRAMERAYRKLVKKVNVPGFRPGKAPRIILERHIGKQALINEAVEMVIPEAYFQAVEDTGIEPVAQPQLELVQVEEGKPVVFKARVVVKPEVELGQYSGLEVTRRHGEVTADDVQRELERLQQRYAQLVTLDEGTVEKGDLVTLDFTGRVNGEPFEGGQATDYTLEVGSGRFVPGFEDQLVGMAINESRDIQVRFPGDYPNKELAGKEAEFTVTIKAVKRKELASLDDEFAKDVSEFDTLEELRSDLENKLKEAAGAKARAEMRREVLQKAVDNARVDIPQEMIDSRVEEMLQSVERRLLAEGINLDMYLKYQDTTLEQMREKFRPDAHDSLKTMLVLDAIARVENIKVSEEEIQAEIEKMAAEMHQDPAVVRKVVESQGQLEAVTQGLVREKVMQLLLDRANIIEHDEEPEAKPVDEPAAEQ